MKTQFYKVFTKEEAVEKIRKCYRLSMENAIKRYNKGYFHFRPYERVVPYFLVEKEGRILNIKEEDGRYILRYKNSYITRLSDYNFNSYVMAGYIKKCNIQPEFEF